MMERRRDDPKQLRLFDAALPSGTAPSEPSAPEAQPVPPPDHARRRSKPTPSAEPGPAAVSPDDAATARRLSKHVLLGTSSWSFPGWAGIVYDRETDESTLARGGLRAYAQHPLLRAAGVDRTYYRPITAAAFRQLADQTPADFRFLVKAAQDCTVKMLRTAGADELSPNPVTGRDGARGAAPNPSFLNPAWTIERVVEPFVDGLGAKGGALVFQFSRFRFQKTASKRGAGAAPRTATEFLDRLAAFLGALPRGVPYTVEVRNEELWGKAYFGVLRAAGASHCYNVHPQMPPIAEQARVLPPADNPGPLVVRWMLERSQTYAGARDAYAPFDRLVDEDPDSRAAIAALSIAAARVGRDILVIANNKAEGSAPLTVFRLAREIVAGWEDEG
jgi:uncharacterized protein YecE (DUF72 family)